MLDSAIRQIAASRDGTRAAAAFFSSTVQIWDLDAAECATQFQSVLDFGGHRLDLSPDGSRCVVASWRGGSDAGVACHDTMTGFQLWHRPDVMETQHISFCLKQLGIWCIADSGAAIRIDDSNGKTLEERRGIERIIESPYFDHRLVERHRGGYVLEGPERVLLPKNSFALLDAAIGLDEVCIAEPRAPLRCLRLSGEERWRFDIGPGRQFVRVWFSSAQSRFFALATSLGSGPTAIVAFEPATGQAREISKFSSWDAAAAPDANRFITCHGDLHRLSDGDLVASLAFPQTVYPDKD